MDRKETYQDKLRAQLDEFTALIARLRVEAEKTQGEMRLNHMAEIEELRAYRRRAETYLEELQRAQGEAWKDMRSGIEAAREEMGEALKRAWKRFS